jgi:hypothetical protein
MAEDCGVHLTGGIDCLEKVNENKKKIPPKNLGRKFKSQPCNALLLNSP